MIKFLNTLFELKKSIYLYPFKIMALISVVIPCYNASLFLPQTLDSVLSQTFKNFEVIAIDDGSTDSTPAILLSYGEKIRYESRPNTGASAARNRGTELATGEYIQYLDADDILLPEALEHRLDALKESKADVAYSDWQKLEEQSNAGFKLGEVVSRNILDSHPDPQIALFIGFWCPPAALLYHRNIVDKIGCWNETLPIIQDARFLLDAALVGGTFVHVPETLAYYRVHRTSSLSKRDKVAFAVDCYVNALQVEEFWHESGGLTLEQKIALIKSYGQYARFFFEHDRTKFHEIVSRLHQLDPGYLPSGPMSLRILSKWLGYEQAESLALSYRRAKKILQNLVAPSV